MAKIVLAEADLDALLAVICVLQDMPLQTRHDAEALRARPPLLKRNLPPQERVAGTENRPDYPGKDGSLRVQIAALNLALGRWQARGEVPPSLAPTLIQFMLTAAQAETFEKAFLAAFCYHFGAEYAERFGHLVERAVKLGVYPLPMKAVKVERPADRFARTTQLATYEAGAAEPEFESPPAATNEGLTLAASTTPPSLTSRLVRKARFGLQASPPPPPAREGSWRPLGGPRR